MRHNAVIHSVPYAYEVLKEMNLDSDQGEREYRSAGRRSKEKILEERVRANLYT